MTFHRGVSGLQALVVSRVCTPLLYRPGLFITFPYDFILDPCTVNNKSSWNTLIPYQSKIQCVRLGFFQKRSNILLCYDQEVVSDFFADRTQMMPKKDHQIMNPMNLMTFLQNTLGSELWCIKYGVGKINNEYLSSFCIYWV